jgi:hypothetical protein
MNKVYAKGESERKNLDKGFLVLSADSRYSESVWHPLLYKRISETGELKCKYIPLELRCDDFP